MATKITYPFEVKSEAGTFFSGSEGAESLFGPCGCGFCSVMMTD